MDKKRPFRDLGGVPTKPIELHSSPPSALLIPADDELVSVLPQAFVTLAEFCKRNQILGRDHVQVRELGEAICKLGGQPAMQMAHYMIQAMAVRGFLGLTHEDVPEVVAQLNIVWDGIGAWRS